MDLSRLSHIETMNLPHFMTPRAISFFCQKPDTKHKGHTYEASTQVLQLLKKSVWIERDDSDALFC